MKARFSGKVLLAILAATGAGLIYCFYHLRVLSAAFVYGEGHRERPILAFLSWCFAAFLFYVLALLAVHFSAKGAASRSSIQPNGKGWLSVELILILAVGVTARWLLMDSRPIQEVDYVRYLWDGASLANGVNPYRFSPEEVYPVDEPDSVGPDRFRANFFGGAHAIELPLGASAISSLETLRGLRLSSEEARFAHRWISYPRVRTIYPPLAQVVFAGSYAISPWSLGALRFIFLLFETAAILLLIDALIQTGRSPLWILTFAWSPLAIKELVNSPHLDAMVVFCLALGVWCWVRGWFRWLGVALGLGVLAKTFPLILLPAAWIATSRRKGPSHAWQMGLLCVGVIVLGYLPFVVSAGWLVFDGHFKFASQWATNSSLFGLLAWVAEKVTRTLGRGTIEIQGASIDVHTLIARACCGLALLGCVGFFASWKGPWKRNLDEINPLGALDLPARWLFTVAALFLLAPTGNPWYVTWLLPMLCLVPVRGLILLSGTVFLYYFKFLFTYHDSFYAGMGRSGEDEFWVIRVIEYGSVYLVLAWDGLRWWLGRREAVPVSVPTA